MAKFRIWHGDKPKYKKLSSLKEAVKVMLKTDAYDEDSSGLEQNYDGEWDEWLDEDDQNIHEHLFMYGSRSRYLRGDDEDDDDFDDEYDEDGAETEDDDMEERLMKVIGGNSRPKSNDVDDEDDDDDSGDEDDDFDDGYEN